MTIVRINGKTINAVNGKKVRAIHYGNKTWYLENVDFIITISNNQVTITGYTGSDTDIIIPSIMYGYPVVSISDEAFINKTNLTSIEIPDSVTSIGNSAFRECTNLTSINIPDGITNLPNYVFIYCTSLASIEIPDSVTNIGVSAFNGCTSLTSITIPDSVSSIGEYVFQNCSSLESIIIPNSVTSISSFAFRYCTGLTSVELGNGITSIGDSAFHECTSLTSIEIPDSVTSIGNSAFRTCTNLTSINIPNEVTSIGDSAFAYCSNLTSIEIPDSVTNIGSYAFIGCSGLTSITFKGTTPPTITDNTFSINYLKAIYVPSEVVDVYKTSWTTYADLIIGYSADFTFEGTTITAYNGTATEVVIPEGVTAIGNNVFDNRSDITSITLPSTLTDIGDSAFIGCSGLTSIDLPDGLLNIGERAFQFCSRLTEVVIPSSVITIGNYGLQLGTLLGTGDAYPVFIFKSSVPPTIGTNVFPLISGGTIVIQVPSGYGEVYQTYNDNWSAWAEYIIEEQTGYTLTFNVDSSIYNYDDYFYSLDSGSTWNAIDSATMTVENVSKIRFKATSVTYGMNIGTSSGGSDIASVIYSETEDIVVTADATWYFDYFGGGADN